MKVFVYGTLKRGESNHSLLSRSTYIGEALTLSKFDMLNSGFPVLFHNDKGHRVSGEVFEIDEDTLHRLDSLEGEGSMYFREKVYVDTVNEEVFIYVGSTKFWDHKIKHRLDDQYLEDGVHTWRPR